MIHSRVKIVALFLKRNKNYNSVIVSFCMQEFEDRMKKALEAVEKEFHTIRTGKANPTILDRINVDYYGSQMQLKALANITAIDGRTLGIIPFDKGGLKDIEKAIQDSGLGLTPNNDGSRILIIIPELTGERRQELAKLVNKEAEQGRISIRNVRRDALDKSKKEEGSEDAKKREQDDIQKLTDKYIKLIDELTKKKEEEILKI